MLPLKKTQHLLEYAGLRLLVGLVKLLPAQAALRVGRSIGAGLRFVFTERVRLAHENLQLAFGNRFSREEQSGIITKLLMLQGESLVESIITNGNGIADQVTVTGMDHLERALAKNRGVILLGPHFAMWELAGFIFGLRLAKVSTVYKAMKNPYVDAYLLKTREKSNLGLISSKNALRPVFSRLKKGEAVVMLFDQNAGRTGLPVTFFGKTAFTYSAPAVFALKTGCAVIAAYMIREGTRRHRLVINEPFPLIDTGNMESDILANTQQYNDFLEGLVSACPEQWFGWLHKRWKIPSTRIAKAA